MALVEALTIDDFEKLPQTLALNHELVDGELVDVSGNTAEHNQLRDLLVRLLAPVAEQLGGIIISEQEFDFGGDRKSTRLNSSHIQKSRMPSSA